MISTCRQSSVRLLLLAGSLLLLLLAAGCFFGPDDDGPSRGGGGSGCGASAAAACSCGLQTACTKIHECTTAEDKTADSDSDGVSDFQEIFGLSVGECVTILDEGATVDLGGTTFTIEAANCSWVTADNACDDQGVDWVYSQAAALECMTAQAAMTCTEFNDGTAPEPEACTRVCVAP